MTGRTKRDALARFEHRFTLARERLADRISDMFAEHAAKGHLKSGATIKRAVRLVDDVLGEALTECLSLIGNNTDSPDRRRRIMMAALGEAFASGWALAQLDTVAALQKTGLANDVKYAVPLLENAYADQTERFREFRDGWTAPRPKAWTERHPIFYGILAALGGGLLTKAIDLFVVWP